MSNCIEIKIDRDEAVIDKLVENIYKKYRLPKNQTKGGHLNMTTKELVKDLLVEVFELIEAVEKLEYDNTFQEAADVANYAAFLADPERIKEELARKIFA